MLKLLALVVTLFALVAPSAAAWRRPVGGPVARAFSYSPAEPFRRGWHRGVSLAARPGTTVRAACTGRVVTATWSVVTIRCGAWRVTHLPLATIRVHAGASIREGARIGTVSRGAAGTGGRPALYISVRRAGDRFAYVDPLSLLPPRDSPRTPVPIAAPDDRGRRPAPIPALGPPPRPSARVRVPGGRPLAPWPVWVGLGLALTGAVGGGIGVRVRRTRVRREAVASAP